jgi:hypothetical protein
MVTRGHKIKLVILISLLLTLIAVPTLAAGEPRLILAAETLQAATSQEMVVRLLVEDASPTVAVQAHLTFDPATLQVVALDHGDFLTKAPVTDAYVWQNRFDNEAGTLDYALLLNPTQPPAEGNGLLATITFQVRRDGPATIGIQKGFFFDPNGVKMAAQTDSVPHPSGGETATEIASAVPSQPLADQTAGSVSQPPEVESKPLIQERPVQAQMGSATTNAGEVEVNPAAPVLEPEPPAEVTQSLPAGPRYFRIEAQPSFGHQQLPALMLLVGLGGMVLGTGFIGLVGIVAGWFWLVRARRHRSRRSASVQIIELGQNYPISLPPIPVRRIGPP